MLIRTILLLIRTFFQTIFLLNRTIFYCLIALFFIPIRTIYSAIRRQNLPYSHFFIKKKIQISSLFACPGKHNSYHIVSNVNLSFYRSFSYLEKYFYFKFNTNELSSLDFLSLNPTSSSFSCLSAYAPIREAIKK